MLPSTEPLDNMYTNMFMLHLITNNGDEITTLLSVFPFEPNEIHGHVFFSSKYK